MVDPLDLEKCQMGWGSGLDNVQLNNRLTHTYVLFDIFHFPGNISKYDSLDKFDPPWKKV